MYVKTLEPCEMIEMKKLWSICFLSEMDLEAAKKQEVKRDDSSTCYGCFTDSGEQMAGMLSCHLMMNFDGKYEKLSGIGGVVTHPVHRRSGAIRSLFEKLLRDERDAGTVFSGLYPFSHPFYRKFGYELARFKKTYTFPVSALAKYASDMDVRMLLPEDDRAPLLPVYEAFARRYNLAIERDANAMKRSTHSNPYEKNDYTYAIYEDGACIAYVAYSLLKRDGINHLNVRDYAFTSRNGLLKILGFLSRMSAQFSKIEMYFPDDLPICALIDAPYEIKLSGVSDYMIRVLNVEKALSLMDRGQVYRFVIEVDDGFLPENSGRWLVTPGKCEKTELPADAIMSIQTFSQMITGFLSFDEASLKTDVQVFSNAETLERVFIKKDVFVGVSY